MRTETSTESSTRHLINSVYFGDIEGVRSSLEFGADINAVDPATGLSPLHIAVGRNHLQLVEFLLEKGAIVCPDRQGRWPSTIAELCEARGKICDLIVNAEAALGNV